MERIIQKPRKEDFSTLYNPIFKNYISIVDESFVINGTKLNLDSYVLRENNFEEEYFLSAIKRNSSAKPAIEILTGKVGSGKTTFIQYIEERIIDKIDGYIRFHIDIAKISGFDPVVIPDYVYEKLFSELFDVVLNKNFNNDRLSFIRELNISDSNSINLSDIEHIKYYNEIINSMKWKDRISYIFKFINKLDKIQRVVIIFDNIDENSGKIISLFRKISLEIHELCIQKLFYKSPVIIIPIRDYNSRFFSGSFIKTENFQPTSLRPVPIIEVCRSKIKDLTTRIKEEFIPMEFPIVAKVKNGGSIPNYDLKIKVGKENIVEYLTEVLKYLEIDDDEKKLSDFIIDLSSGNHKFSSLLLFNFLQSVDINIQSLIENIFDPSFKGENFKVKIEDFLKALMSVHEPFYNQTNSPVLNIFNLKDSIKNNDFLNILIIPRILFYLKHNKETSISSISSYFEIFFPAQNYFSKSIDKLFNFGLLDSEYGCCYKDLFGEKDSTLKLSTAGNLYVNNIFYRFSYLSNVCEATPMPVEFIIEVNNKYETKIHRQSTLDRFQQIKSSVALFISFVESQENLEHKYGSQDFSGE
ncbi:MAG TPA: hypothetical protein PLJ21_11235 [Pseudobdellovibrionaceae bacterium]|nr:hypothetical protein [Pseudobdellovibrionaceae bacterium]